MTITSSHVTAATLVGRRIRIFTLLAAIGCCSALTSSAAAQLRPTAIRDATLLTGDGRTIQGGTVVLNDGKIEAVGRGVKPPLLARKIRASGKYVTPGLIDVYSTLALRYVNSGDRATSAAADAFDRYARDEIEAAWREGVTAAYLPARGGNGVGGLGAVIRFLPLDHPDDPVLCDEAALSSIVGVNTREGPLTRVAVAQELAQRFKAAREYRESWEDYQEDLKEYEEKLAERAKKKEKEQSSKKKDGKQDGKKKAAAAPDEQKRKKGRNAKQGGKKKDEKKDELKKPTEPKKDRNAEVLLRVIDGELRLRVEAHHPADILNVIEVTEEYNLALLLEGASGAYLVADRLAETDVPVVLWEEPMPVAYVGGTRRHARPDSAAILKQAGVDVYFGSGVLPTRTAGPQLALRAARAVSQGCDQDAAFEAITLGAARLLGVEKQIGRLKKGLRGDVVIWSDHPFAPGATVERVFVGGREVYRADAEAD